MLRLYLRDNQTGEVHEYGTNEHDSLILQEDGSIHYENMQNMTGTMFPEEGYTFVMPNGIDPRTDEEAKRYEVEPYLDIGGESEEIRRYYISDNRKILCEKLWRGYYNVTELWLEGSSAAWRPVHYEMMTSKEIKTEYNKDVNF